MKRRGFLGRLLALPFGFKAAEAVAEKVKVTPRPEPKITAKRRDDCTIPFEFAEKYHMQWAEEVAKAHARYVDQVIIDAILKR